MLENAQRSGLAKLGSSTHGAITSPALVVNLDRARANVARMAHVVAGRGARLRPHAKTHKSIEFARLQLEHGATGITVATMSEAAMFVRNGITDIFVAYPVRPTGEREQLLAWLMSQTATLRVGVDSVEGAQLLSSMAGATASRLGVLIEVDCGGGRSGVRSIAGAHDVATTALAGGLDVVGLFTHGGHSYGSKEAVGGAAEDEVQTLNAFGEELRREGIEVSELSAGSSPTSVRSSRSGVTEERPGTYVFNDRLQVALGSCTWDDVALTVQSTVVSVDRDQVILDAGAKVLSNDLPHALDGYGILPAYPDARIRRLYDHHAVVEAGEDGLPSLGELVTVVPNHVCPVVNLADTLTVVSGEASIDVWPVDGRGLVL